MYRHRLLRWLRRYAPPEVAATAGALLGALIGVRVGAGVGAAVGGDVGEALAFYAVVVAQELRGERAIAGPRPLRRILLDLLAEFGPAEAVDSFALRPLAMYAGPFVTGDLLTGTIAGKVAADLVFYAVAAVGYERRRSHRVAVDPLAPEVLDAAPHRTPYLVMDLDRVVRAYRTLRAALPVDEIHYATKCNADPGVLAALHRAGCRFEIASYPELVLLRKVGVRAADVLFSNPVKPPDHIARAYAAGCWRFAVDSAAELEKIAAGAPGAAVYVRLDGVPGSVGTVPSEGKFGIGLVEAADLLLDTARRGLRPYGVTFHVGSQMTRPEAWSEAIDRVGLLLTWLAERGLRLEMIDIGGGFPARYSEDVPPPTAYAEQIRGALDRLPYRPRVVAEPGRALVAEAGVLVTTVLGHARRRERDWVHLDVGAFNGMMEALETGRPTYPLSDSRRGVPGRCHLAGPSCDSQDTVLFDAALSADLMCGDRVYIGSAGAYTTAYASRFNGFDIPAVRCVRSFGDPAPLPGAVPKPVSRPYGS